MSAMITFAADLGSFRKRKRVHRACEGCKKRRRKCSHVFDEETHRDSNDEMPSNNVQDVESSTSDKQPTYSALRSAGEGADVGEKSRTSRQEHSPGQLRAPHVTEARNDELARFAGYLSPEATFISDAVGRGHGGRHPSKDLTVEQHHCGFWVPLPHTGSHERVVSQSLASSSHVPAQEGNEVARSLKKAYLDALGVYKVPSRQHSDVLVQVYFDFIHPILPIVNEDTFMRKYLAGAESRVLLQAICTVAAKHDRARPHLYLDRNTKLLSPRDFAKELFTSVEAALQAKLEPERITLIQVLSLLSMHCEGFDGADQASLNLSQAIHHAHTVGLQFGRNHDARSHGPEALFWSLWSMDKLNCCMNGRPLLMHERDNHIPKPTESSNNRTPFGIWLRLADALDQVICYYRPGLPPEETGWEDDFPSFEDIIGDGGDSIEPPILAVLELFYHAVAMNSHRSMSVSDPIRSTPSFTRQSLSAVRVVSILRDEAPDNLPPLPIVPYALSLAASVAYRRFRQSKLQTYRTRGKEELKRCCELLDKLRVSWWSAGAIADLGKAALSKAEKQPSSSRAATVSRTICKGPQLASETVQFRTDACSYAAAEGSTPETANANAMERVPAIDPHISVDDFAVGPVPFLQSPDWLNFDNAFDNLDTLLGSSGADVSNEMLRPFSHDMLDSSFP